MKRLALAFALIFGLLAAPASASFTTPLLPTATQTAVTTRPWQAAARVKVHMGGGAITSGSGTVISGDAQLAYVLTCAHVFVGGGDPKAFSLRIEVDLFDGKLGSDGQTVGYLRTCLGRCVDFDTAKDVGLIAIAPGAPIPFVPPVPKGWLPKIGERLVAVGCGGGEDAKAWTTSMVRYVDGQQNGYTGIECSTAPRQGRSGGGLHRADGRVCGVCDFAATQSNTGIYAAPVSIHAILDRNGLDRLVNPTQATPPRPMAPQTAPEQTSPPAVTPPVFDLSDPVHLTAVALAAGLVSVVVVMQRKRLAGVAASPMASAPTLTADTVKALLAAAAADEDREARAKEAEELLSKFREALKAFGEKPSAADPKEAA